MYFFNNRICFDPLMDDCHFNYIIESKKTKTDVIEPITRTKKDHWWLHKERSTWHRVCVHEPYFHPKKEKKTSVTRKNRIEKGKKKEIKKRGGDSKCWISTSYQIIYIILYIICIFVLCALRFWNYEILSKSILL